MPELTSFVDVGLTSITRNLEKLAACTSSDQLSTSASLSPYTVIFVARSGQSSAVNSQLPEMVAVASSSSSEPPTRLVGYSKPCAERLSAALGIPRVSSVGIRVGAPVSKALVDFVQQHVAPVKIAWMEEAHDATYRQTKLRVEEKVITVKKSRQVMNKDEQE
ncbi:hypothetical protein C8034_v001165 [Colletotrichum sidae]|uniref:Uncharacterized protein n=1 Tax=Colletotrichum sidae TaxID=1347389 RepID=A0A4R8TEB3_9PEZI|nr:hypothetical protein C8034_v001165 [Colletotrichum sidae]